MMLRELSMQAIRNHDTSHSSAKGTNGIDSGYSSGTCVSTSSGALSSSFSFFNSSCSIGTISFSTSPPDCLLYSLYRDSSLIVSHCAFSLYLQPFICSCSSSRICFVHVHLDDNAGYLLSLSTLPYETKYPLHSSSLSSISLYNTSISHAALLGHGRSLSAN